RQEPKMNLTKKDINETLQQLSNPVTVKFDSKDIELLRKIKEIYHHEKASITYIDLGKSIGLSDTQIRRKIQRLEKKKVIRGYLTHFNLPGVQDIHAYLFFELKKAVDFERVVSVFYRLPFQISIGIESETKFFVYFRPSTKDLANVLQGIELLKPLFSSMFLQVLPFYHNPRYHLFEAYNKEKHCWETPMEKYIALIQEY
ncbi:MAG: Lrp/AsnC family transcriptional regulator, partial [Candidatus Odinarchaeota archaeon]